MNLFHFRVAVAIGLCLPFCGLSQPTTEKGPPFQEVFDLVRSNLVGVNETALNEAALQGFVSQLYPQVILVTNVLAGQEATNQPIAKSITYEDTFAYFQIAKVESNLADALGAAFEEIREKNKLKGLILDLRFADGTDYSAAANTADRFVSTERPLLSWDDNTMRSSAKVPLSTLPMTVLVNRKTSGAAEALVAILRETELALVIGTNTAGRAQVFQEFPLSGGTRLKIATTPVKLGNGRVIPPTGLIPDILVSVSEPEEKAYLENPYKPASTVTSKAASSGPSTASTSTSRTPRHRLNEADLVRMQREGSDFADISSAGSATESDSAIVRDPVLARGLDLLKGLAVVHRTRPR
jgi:hypothetical protein